VRVLMTGATGFVGYVVADRLRRAGHTVCALTRSERRLPPGVERLPGDLRNPASITWTGRFDAACHLAGLARVRDSRADPLGYWRTNAGGTLALLEALVAQPGPPALLVLASTCAVYGADAPQPVDEDAEPRPEHPYGASKLAADRMVADVAATGAIGAVSLRAFNVAGGVAGHADRDETRLVPKIVAVAQGRAPELVVNGDGSVIRDFLHVADMADAFLHALVACRPGHFTAYNVGAGRGSTIAEVIAAGRRWWDAGCRCGTGRPRGSRASWWPTAGGSGGSWGGRRSGRTCTASWATPTRRRAARATEHAPNRRTPRPDSDLHVTRVPPRPVVPARR
jgi:UDP-glucose 4-epimerase